VSIGTVETSRYDLHHNVVVQQEYLMVMKNKSLHLRIGKDAGGSLKPPLSLSPTFTEDDNLYDNIIYPSRHVTFRDSFRTILCHHLTLTQVMPWHIIPTSVCEITVIPYIPYYKEFAYTQEITVMNSLARDKFKGLAKKVLPNLTRLNLHNTTFVNSTIMEMLLTTNIKHIHVFGDSTFSNYDCLEGKIEVHIHEP